MAAINPNYTNDDYIKANKDYSEWVGKRNDAIKEKYSELSTTLKNRDISDKDINNILYGKRS